MQLPKIGVRDEKLPTLLSDMQTGQLQVPRFQRDFVWPLTKTRALLDSMYKEFPVGTFFLWRAPVGSPPLSRPLEELKIPEASAGAQITYILDGQQRLTSLFVAIYGFKLGSRDYGRICLDLEIATKYDGNKDDGFDEDIFVSQEPDNKRYVAVCKLVGPDNPIIYEGLKPDWKSAFLKASNMFKVYPFSVVWIQEQRLGDAIEIFQRINQAGKRLSRYDLVCANVWTHTFDFRQRVTELNKVFEQQGFGALDETIYTQTFALIVKDQCATEAELTLTTEEILKVWDKVIKSLQVAVDFAFNNLGVKRAEFLPYRGILVVLAYCFYHRKSSAITASERNILWNWFWRVTLSERYSSTSPSRMAEDAKKLRNNKKQEAIFNYPSKVTEESVARTKMTSTTSAMRNAVLCMLALREPRNLKDNSPVNLTDNFFANVKQPERHHIFPIGYLKSKRIKADQVHHLPNFCFIPSDLNQEISGRAPAEYLAQYKSENSHFAVAASSHLIPVETGQAVWTNEFDAFLSQRSKLIADTLNGLIDVGPLAPLVQPVIPANEVDVLEVRLRDFIDHRLQGTLGRSYWKKAMPGDVITSVRELITNWQNKHPYEEQPHSGRARLDFCDVSHYEKICLKNWEQFGEIFRDKNETQKHLAAYKNLRDPIQHNRTPTVVVQKNGEAAIIWLNGVIDQYYALLEESNAEDSDGNELETAMDE